MKYILFILLFNFCQGQSLTERWNKMPEDKRENLDHAFDFYRGMGISWVTSEIIKHYTNRPILAGFIGFGTGCLQGIILERGLYGKIVSCGGSMIGQFAYVIRWDIKERKRKEYLEKRKIFES